MLEILLNLEYLHTMTKINSLYIIIILGVSGCLKPGIIKIYLKTITIIENTIMTNL
jgi:hypothetical protein